MLPCFLGAAGMDLVRITDAVPGTRTAWLGAHPDVARPRVRAVIDHVIAVMNDAEPLPFGQA